MNTVKLPKRVNHKTPMPLIADAYTVGSETFASKEAKRKSIYYITFRRILEKINPDVYAKGDNRIIFHGLSRILDYLFYDGVTKEEVEESVEFLSMGQVTSKGLMRYNFPKHLWDKIVSGYNGRPPLRIKALKEGSVCYPNEPVMTIENVDDAFSEGEMGEIAAWFESTLLKVWASSELVTQLVHWKEYCASIVRTVYGNTKTESEIQFLAGLMLFNFGCRAGMTPQESEWLGADFLLVFGGSDTLSGAYQAWKNGNKEPGIYTTVPALAHRNVQAYEKESDCYKTMYETSDDGAILSMVCDCYSSYDAVEKDLFPLAKHAAETNNGKTIIGRFDSGNPNEQVLWLCKFAHKHGLSTVEKILNKEWRFGTTLKMFEGDGMTFSKMKEINEELMAHGFPPFAWGAPYGQGGGVRNDLKRDNLSAKYALCAVGEELRPVCKFSETIEKTTLPGPLKVLRSKEALESKRTIVFMNEPGEDALIPYFDGSIKEEPFREGYGATFQEIRDRITEQFSSMPKTLTTEENHNYPISEAVHEKRIQLLKQYAPKKLAQNY